MFQHLTLLFIFSSLSANLFAQGSQNPIQINSTDGVSTGFSSSRNDRKELTLSHIRNMVGDISNFQSRVVKADALSQIADIIWLEDEGYARDLFTEGLRLTSVQSDDNNSKAAFYLRQEIVARVAKHDAKWARLLIDRTLSEEDERQSAIERRELNIETAKRLEKEDPKLAVEFAERSLQGGISPEFIWFLKSLRQRNEALANQLFLHALDQISQQPVDANSFAMFGTYIFTSPRLDGSDPTSVMITRVGDIGMIDITANLPRIPSSLIRAYLQTAVAILNRQIIDPQQRKISYALGYLLIPKAREFAPQLVSPLGAAMASLSTNVSPVMTQEAAFANINKRTVESPEQIMSNAAKLPDSESRDVAYLDVAYRAWLKKEFAMAQTACDKLEDKDAHSQLKTLIEFGKASAKLKDNNPQLFEAAEIANKLPQGIERAVLYLSIAEVAFKDKYTTLANECLTEARNAIQSVTDSRKPHLSLLAAGQLARYDETEAEPAFINAVKEFNTLGDKASPATTWTQKVQTGALVESFPLTVTGLDFSLSKALRASLSVGSVESNISKAREFKNERLRMSAFVALAHELLKTLSNQRHKADGRMGNQ